MTNSPQFEEQGNATGVEGDAPLPRRSLRDLGPLGCVLAVIAIALVPNVVWEILGGLWTRGLGRDSTLFLSAAIGLAAATIGFLLLVATRSFGGRWFFVSLCVLAWVPHACVSGLGLVGQSMRTVQNTIEAPGLAACKDQSVRFNLGPVQAEGYLREMSPSTRFGLEQIRHRLVREGFQFIEERAPDSPTDDFRDRIAGSGAYIRYQLSASGDAACAATYDDGDFRALNFSVGGGYVPDNLRSAHHPGVPHGLCIAATRVAAPRASVVVRRDDFVLDNGVRGWRTTVTDADHQVVAEEKSFVIWEPSPPDTQKFTKTCNNLDPELSKPASMRAPGYSPFLDPDRVVEPAATRAFTAARSLEADSPVAQFYSWADARRAVDVPQAQDESKLRRVPAEIVQTTTLGETVSLAAFNERYPNPSHTLLGSVYSRGDTIFIHDADKVLRISLSSWPIGIRHWGGVQWALRDDDGFVVISGIRIRDAHSGSEGGISANFRILQIDQEGRITGSILAEFGPRSWVASRQRRPIADVSVKPGGLKIRFVEFESAGWKTPRTIQLHQQINVSVPMELDAGAVE